MTVATGICLGEGTSTSGWGWLELASPASQTLYANAKIIHTNVEHVLSTKFEVRRQPYLALPSTPPLLVSL